MEILKIVKSRLPKGVVEKIELEGCEIIVYTKDKDFFRSHEETIRSLVAEIKKRIEVRADISICLDQEATKKIIQEIVPKEAKIHEIYFEPERSIVVIGAEKPGLVIGKGGTTFREIKKKTFWAPRIERVPPIRSKIVDGVRKMIHREVKFRKKFLKKIGESIFTKRETKRNWIRITALGGFREVGRSCALIETPKSRILVDCGVNVGASNTNAFPYLNVKEFDINELDAIVISHTHLDHAGFVPFLYKYGFEGPTYVTPPTRDVFTLLCLDYIDVLQRNGVEPPYDAKDVKNAVKHMITLEYGEVSDIAPDVRLTFQNAGHLLGSALIHLHIGEGLHNIVWACDMKYGKSSLFDPAFTNFQRVETLILESTYGSPNDVMPPRREAEKQLVDIINETMKRGGQVLIPSFGVGRGQDVMVILAKHNFEFPVFIDGMIWDATGIHTAYPEYMSREIQRDIFNDNNPFTKDIFKRVASQADREKVFDEKPCVIISTSGSLVGGPAIEYLKNMCEDEKNTLIFVGYQFEGTLGRRIQRGWREIPLHNKEGKSISLPIRMEVKTVEGLSGHSDYKQLINFVKRLKPKLGRIIVAHGEEKKCKIMKSILHKIFRIETVAPKNLETVRIV
ncbi:MAG TPA: beta-CASP ribonuclease aCPSF1 [Candidatus Aenigmarchaeota archaeon]|nr:beta-CASP ribonuclease aCPSF1 [Candidatus Aenigmarchaeota archaeon]